MLERDLLYWLRGYFEISGKSELTSEQITLIRKHMEIVQDPSPLITAISSVLTISGAASSIVEGQFDNITAEIEHREAGAIVEESIPFFIDKNLICSYYDKKYC